MPSAENPLVLRDFDGRFEHVTALRGVAVFPGAFNPFHTGHQKLCEAAERILDTEVVFEVSVTNVAKPSLSTNEVYRRVEQFPQHRVSITRAQRFCEKSELFPGCWFVVGYDTARRILEPRFYQSRTHMVSALDAFRAMDHRFLVGGRVQDSGSSSMFCEVRDLNVPPQYAELFCGLREAEFRADISSTKLREHN